MESDAAPPEAVLIKEVREAIRPKLSQTAAAKKIGLSGTRWRQIESGYQTPSAGVRNRVVAPAETLALMARVVGVTEDQLKEVGRGDAAKELAAMSSRSIGRGLASLIPKEPTSPQLDYFYRAERQLHHVGNSIRAGDHLGAINGLEGVQSTVELLIDRITDLATGEHHAVQTSAAEASESDASTEEPEVEEDSGGSGPSDHDAERRPSFGWRAAGEGAGEDGAENPV